VSSQRQDASIQWRSEKFGKLQNLFRRD
jgi:hypothetical protein